MRLRTAATWLGGVVLLAGCIDRPVIAVPPTDESQVHVDIPNDTTGRVDLLLEVDNSNSMIDNQANLMGQFGLLIRTLTDPPCVSPSNPTPHTCNAADPTDQRKYTPVQDLHVGVISQDLGTPGSNAYCSATGGDDGLLNPLRQGPSELTHEPWNAANMGGAAPAGFRPDGCDDPNAFPTFLTYGSGTDSATFERAFRCVAGLYVHGCGLEQQLEAVFRALVERNPGDGAGNADPNAGFLRADALLAIVVLTDEEDGSVRDCNHADGSPCDPSGSDPNPMHNSALSVYDPNVNFPAGGDLNLRFYQYQPGSAFDPNWPLERYVDPANLRQGLLSLKPDHPERILFAAVTGVPLDTQTVTDPTSGATTTDWNALLGAPASDGPDDFYGRDSSQAVDTMTPTGHISMHAANVDPGWACGATHRTVPACRRALAANSHSATSCTNTGDDGFYFAWPSRRVVEIARRFDESTLCAGAPCHNGLVTSICSTDYSAAMSAIVAKIQGRLPGRCVMHPLSTYADASGNRVVNCNVQETLPAGHACSELPGGMPLTDHGVARTIVGSDGQIEQVCSLQQVGVNAADQPVTTSAGGGWYYDVPTGGSCGQQITFTPDARPMAGADIQLDCIQALGGPPDASATGP